MSHTASSNFLSCHMGVQELLSLFRCHAGHFVQRSPK